MKFARYFVLLYCTQAVAGTIGTFDVDGITLGMHYDKLPIKYHCKKLFGRPSYNYMECTDDNFNLIVIFDWKLNAYHIEKSIAFSSKPNWLTLKKKAIRKYGKPDSSYNGSYYAIGWGDYVAGSGWKWKLQRGLEFSLRKQSDQSYMLRILLSDKDMKRNSKGHP